jgi:acyl carrier protein|tara:strand:+ start:443 stop:697 length:255 start_codon:yes stop_codon:yes gene_type:complete
MSEADALTTATLEKLQVIVGNQLGIDKAKVVPSADFTTELGADSLDVVELVMAFEEEFEIEIDDEQAGDMATVQDALDYIVKNL